MNLLNSLKYRWCNFISGRGRRCWKGCCSICTSRFKLCQGCVPIPHENSSDVQRGLFSLLHFPPLCSSQTKHCILLLYFDQESMRAAQAAEREKRAAAAERRMAAATSAQIEGSGSTASSNNARSVAETPNCSFCSDSLSGKVPFHRYSYKYCSTTCMHLHSDVLEDW